MGMLSGAALVDNRTFLGWQQNSKHVRFTFDGRVLRCRMGRRHYLGTALVGVLMGPGFTLAVMPIAGRPSIFAAPLVIQIAFLICSGIGWLVLLSGLFWRREVTFDFVGNTVTFWSRFITSSQEVMRLANVESLFARSVIRSVETNDIAEPGQEKRDTCYLFGFRTKEGRSIHVLETTRQDVVRQVAQTVEKNLRGKVALTAPSWTTEAPMLATPSESAPARSADNLRGVVSLVGFCFAFVGFAAAGFSLIPIGRGMQAQRWPTTQGTVLPTRPNRGVLPFEYHYRVSGRDYSSKRFAIDKANEQMRPTHPPGTVVVVYYNPSNPKDAVLDPSVSPHTKSFAAGGVAVVAGYIVLVALRKGGASEPNKKVSVQPET